MLERVDGNEVLIDRLRELGATFALVHGSRAGGRPRPTSDLDVAAWFAGCPDAESLVAEMPAGVDLLVLNTAPLWIAGRVALEGVLLFDDDPPARVAWQADTRKRHLDDRFRADRMRADFVAAHGRS